MSITLGAMSAIFIALCLAAIGAWLSYARRQDQVMAWARRMLLVLGGGAVGLVVTWVVAFGWDRVPSTTSGVNEVARNVLPIAGGGGCLIASIVLYLVARRRGHKWSRGEQPPTNGSSQ
jgi:hypothetical protein